MSIVLDYFELTSFYKDKYGPKTIILYQVGSFFEMYSLFISKSNEVSSITDIESVSSICNLNIAKKQLYLGDNVDISAPFLPFPKDSTKIKQWIQHNPRSEIVMAGFRDYSLEKFVNIITDSGYTTVVYIQEKDSTGKVITRKLDSVNSPGTYISENSSNLLSNNILSLWIHVVKSSKSPDKVIIGCANINIFTGQSAIFEYETNFQINPTTFDELEKFISEFSPNEIIILHNISQQEINLIIQYTGISSNVPLHVIDTSSKHSNEGISHDIYLLKQSIALNCTKQTYINQIITTFFGTDYCSSNEFTTNVIAVQSFCYLLNFIQEHNPDLVRKISVPIFTNKSSKLILANHTLRQLNIIDDTNNKSSSKLSSVLSFLNCSCTAMGKRNFKYQLLNPTFDCEWLSSQYSTIEHILQKDNLFIPNVRKLLLHVRDIEKINRQIVSNKLNPSTLYSLYNTMQTIQDIYVTYIDDDDILKEYLLSGFSHMHDSNTIIKNVSDFISFLESTFQIHECQYIHSTSFDNNIIQSGVCIELDNLLKKQSIINNNINDIKSFFNNLIKSSEKSCKEVEYIKIHETDKFGISLQVTKKRAITLQTLLSTQSTNININDEITLHPSQVQIINVGTNFQISFQYLTTSTNNLIDIQKQIYELILKTYWSTIHSIEIRWYEHLKLIAQFISLFDVIVSKAYIAREYNYCKPTLSLNDGKSFVDCTDLRHVLIEHLQINEIYVANDLQLGQNHDGIVLFAVNSSGKTSFIRSLGINIILAQSGCYCAASSFHFKPYKSIFCQIEKNDNLFKNMSTFQAEMSCLRVILNAADQNSIILGDELANSTEIQSGISIMVATLIELHEIKCSFIIASHFNQIELYDEVSSLHRLKMMHMSIDYDQENDSLIFNRKLQNGIGMTNYGLSVARSLSMPQNFMDKAFYLRNKYFPTNRGELSLSTTKYNSKKVKSICELCKLRTGDEIHHMQQQNEADENGFIGHFSKDHPANLMSICSKCHDETHKDKNIRITKLKTTSGYKLKKLIT